MPFDFTNNPDLFPAYYEKVFLTYLRENVVTMAYGQKGTIGLNNGRVINWLRMSPLAVATTPITGLPTPSGVTPSNDKVTATLEEYGNLLDLDEFATLTSYYPVLREFADLLGENAVQTLEAINFAKLKAGTKVMYAGSVANQEALDGTKLISKSDIRALYARLRTLKVPTFSDGTYKCFIHPDKILNLFTDAELIQLAAAKPEAVEKGYIGTFCNVTFIETANAPIVTNATTEKNVYQTIVVGQNAYGVVDLNGKQFSLGFTRTDKMDRVQTQYWKGYYACERLEEDRVLRFESN